MVKISDKARGVSAVDGSTKAKIERAALELFAGHGIDGVTTRQIAAASGVSEGAIYRHFSGKDDLARSLMLTIHNRLTDMIHVAGDTHDTLPQMIGFMVRHYCQIADDDWPLFQYHILHLHHFPGLSDKPKDSPLGAAAIILRRAMERGEIENQNAFVLASMVLGIVLQVAQAKVFGYVKDDLSDYQDRFNAAILSVLKLDQEA